MKNKTNLLTMLASAIVGAVAVLSIAAASTPELSYGRFQLLATDSVVFKIDTATGQVWRTYVNGTSKEFMAPNIGTPSLEKNTEK